MGGCRLALYCKGEGQVVGCYKLEFHRVQGIS